MKKIFKYIAICTVALVAYAIAHELATMERGYEAIGGEIFIPFIVLLAKPMWKMIKEPFKELKTKF